MQKKLLGSACALAFLAWPQVVSAQETTTEADEPTRLDTITITATRRAGDVQDVPINVAALGGAQIEEQGLAELADVISYVPGMNIIDRGPRQGNPIIVRGLNADPIGTGDGNNDGGGTVSTYLGEVPLFIDLKLNDMERVEVLLGPQGTLYGAGTLAGAIRYIPTKPQIGLSTFEIRTDLYKYSEADTTSTDYGFTVNLPLTETLAFRASADFLDDSGFVDQPFLVRELGVSNPDPDFSDPDDIAANLFSQNDIDSEKSVSGRAALRWVPNSWLDSTLTYYYQKVDVGGRRISTERSVYPDAGPEIFSAGPFENGKRVPEPNEITNDLIALEVTADLGFAELTSASGYSTFEDDGNRDQNDLLVSLEYSYELFPAFGSFTHEVGEINTFTQEVRLVSTTDSRFNWIVGAFYSEQDEASSSSEFTPNYDTYAINELGFDFLVDRPDDLEYFQQTRKNLVESAFFGELGFDITDKWTVTVGGRLYDYELKEFSAVDFPLFDLGFVPSSLSEIQDAPFDPDLGQSDDGTLFKFNTSYQVTDDALVYLTISEGYRIGNSNGLGACPDFDPDATQGSCALAPGQQFGPNPDDVAQFDERQYGPDQTTNYELGAKTTWLDGALILNGALFFVEWTDPQVSSATVNANIPITINASGAESTGVELQGEWQATDNFNIRGSYSYAKSELTEDVPFLVRTITPPGFGTAFEDGKSGDRLPGSPESQFSVFGKYDIPLSGDFDMSVNAGYAWQSDVLSRTGSRGSSVDLPSFGVANAALNFLGEDWTATLYVNNLFDEYIETAILSTPLNSQVVSDVNGDPVTVRSHAAALGAPRTIGFRLRYKFGG